MKHIVRQIILIVGGVFLLYGVALGLSWLVLPTPSSGGGLDSARAPETLYITEPKYIFLNRHRLQFPGTQLIIVGASNALLGFRQQEVQRLVPDAVVHNLAIGSANITEMGQVIDLVQEVQSAEGRRHTIFVIGVWYGSFGDDKFRWYTPDRHPGDTDIDIERYRYGFYLRTGTGPVALVPSSGLDLAVMMIHPMLVLDRVSRDLTESLRTRMFARPPRFTDQQRNIMTPNDAQKRAMIELQAATMGSVHQIGNEQIDVLKKTIDRIRAAGSEVIIAELPIPRWHEQAASYFADANGLLASLQKRLSGQTGIVFLDMRGADRDADFYDEVHVRPRVTIEWARRLAAVANPMLSAIRSNLAAQKTE